MAKTKPEKEPKKAKAKKTKEKPPKTSKKKKGKGKDAEEVSPEAAAASEAAENAEAAENVEEDGKEKKKKSGRGILDPILCVLIAILAVFEIALVYLWLTTPSAEEIRAQLEAQTEAHPAWSAASYTNRHGTYRPSDIPAPVAAYATSDDIPATAQPAVQPQADASTVPTL